MGKMAEIQDFSGKEDYLKRINEAFEKGFHLQWITLTSSLIEQFMSILFWLVVRVWERRDKKRNEFVNSLRSYQLSNLLYLEGVIDKTLLDKINNFQSRRNTIIHKFILKNERLSELDLNAYFELGKTAFEGLVDATLKYVRVRSISDKISNQLKEKLTQNFQKFESNN